MSENVTEEVVETPEVVEEVNEEVAVEETEEKPKPRSRRAKSNRTDEDPEEPDETVETEEKIVLYVDHPVHWPNTGSLAKGYNLVNKSVAEKWLDKGWARKASASEVKKNYGAG